MRYNDLIETLHNLRKQKATQKEIASILNIGQSSVAGRAQRNSEFSGEELKKIEEFYKINLFDNSFAEITYYDTKSDNQKLPAKSLKFDINLISKIFKRSPENLKIIEATDDSMENEIFEGDVLLVDTSLTNPSASGIYLFTTKNVERIFIKRLYQYPDGALEIISDNPKYDKIIYDTNEIKNMNFEIKGRVIKNLTRGL